MSKRIINLLSITIILIVGLPCLADNQMILAQLFEYAGRAQGGGTWTPADLEPQLYLWLDASDGTTLWSDLAGTTQSTEGGSVIRWDDKSTNANNVTTGAANVPTYTNQTVAFDGVNDYLSVNNANFTQPFSVFIVCRTYTGNASIDTIMDGYQKDSIDFRYKSDSTIEIYSGSYLTRTYPYTNAETSIASITMRRTSPSYVYKNGSLHESQTVSAVNPLGVVIGTYLKPPPERYAKSDIMEIVYCNGFASDTDRQKVEGYLAHKWGLTANLPEDHLYKELAP